MNRDYGTPPRNLLVESGRKGQLPSRGLLDLTNVYWGYKEKHSDHLSIFPPPKVSLGCPYCGRDEYKENPNPIQSKKIKQTSKRTKKSETHLF